MMWKKQMKKDRVFAGKKVRVRPFEFNREVAEVFDDMLHRSVPLYAESIKRQAQLAALYFQAGTRMYDLGCSHGNLGMLILDQFPDKPFSMVGVDNSLPMLERYKKRLDRYKKKGSPLSKGVDCYGKASRIDLVCGLLEDVHIKNASVVLINLTLQFLNPGTRDALLKKIHQGMTGGGILLLTEKIIHPLKTLDDLQTQFYTGFKVENGYSRLEISRKRDALEQVLIPDTLETHEARMRKAGFSTVDVWLKWFNFASMIAIKQ
jgi:tRNA (cmo5U34)-methyltransferase